MVSIFSLIFMTLICCSAIVFAIFVISKLRKIDSQTDSISKHCWSMRVYMDDIPQNEQNTLLLGSVPLKTYERDDYSDFPIPRVGEEVGGVYYSDPYIFKMNGIVEYVFYNTEMNLIVVGCKCIDIQKLK